MTALRHLVIEIWAQNGTKKRFSSHREKLPRAFLEDFLAALLGGDDLAEQRVDLLQKGDDVPEQAASAQMGNREIITPSSRLRSSASPSPRVMTPVSMSSNPDSKGDITQGMDRMGLNT